MSDIASWMLQGAGPLSRVLVVDDEPLIRWSLSEALSAAGYDVAEAGDGRSALARFSAGPSDISVVLLDLRLPDTDGLSVLSAIAERSPNTPIVLMTAYGSTETTETARRLGAFRVVSKPFDLDRMVGLVKDVLSIQSQSDRPH